MVADQNYQAAADALFGQLQQSQQTAWYDYLDRWYEAEETAGLADLLAQDQFDAAENTAYTTRLAAIDTRRWELARDWFNEGHDDLVDTPLTAADWGDVERPYAIDHNTAET